MGQASFSLNMTWSVSPMKAHSDRDKVMLHYAVVFFIVAIIAAVLGFGVIAGTAA